MNAPAPLASTTPDTSPAPAVVDEPKKTLRAPITDPTERRTILGMSLVLLAAWSAKDAEQADPSLRELAILTVLTMDRHLAAGSSPLDDVVPFTGTMVDAGAAFGEAMQPIVRGPYDGIEPHHAAAAKRVPDARALLAGHAAPPSGPTCPGCGHALQAENITDDGTRFACGVCGVGGELPVGDRPAAPAEPAPTLPELPTQPAPTGDA
jgi:hypothetical protein